VLEHQAISQQDSYQVAENNQHRLVGQHRKIKLIATKQRTHQVNHSNAQHHHVETHHTEGQYVSRTKIPERYVSDVKGTVIGQMAALQKQRYQVKSYQQNQQCLWEPNRTL
jgi:hypothetical protein